MTPLLEIKNLSKHFDGLKAVDRCTFEIQQNSITGLIGPNGAGKTTIFDLITGLLETTEGTMLFKNRDITKMPGYKRARLGMGRTFQLIRIFPELTVLDNMLVVLEEQYQSLKYCFLPKKKRMHEKAMEYLKKINLNEQSRAYAKNLSYGQQKLLEIIRAVGTGAELLLLDEPAAGINPNMLQKIKELILELKKEGHTILIVEHNMPFIMEICEKIIVMDCGKELMTGPPEKVQNDPRVLEAYLGKRKVTLTTTHEAHTRSKAKCTF